MKFKKMLTSAMVSGTILAPIAATFSCGSKSSHADLIIGIRAEDQELWNSVATQFTKATGKSVKFRWVQDQNNDYTMWSSSGMMPDITIADSNWARTGGESGWFTPINVPEIVQDKNLKITGQDSAYAETDLKYDGNHFETAMMETMKRSDGMFNGLSVIYGPKITYAWRKLPKASGGEFDLFDGTQDLKWYVPKEDGTIEEVTTFNSPSNANDSPLFSHKKDHHRLKNTPEDVQEFLSNAASAQDTKYNTSDIMSANSQPTSRVLSTGTYGYEQRLASISRVIYDFAKAATNLNLAGSDAAVANLKIGATEDSAIKFGGLAYGEQLSKTSDSDVQNAQNHLNNLNILKDGEVFSAGPDTYKWDFKSGHNTKAKLSKLQKLQYYSSLGYFHKGMFGNSHAVSGDDQQVAFAKFKSLFITGGALWMWGGIKDKAEHTFPGNKADDMIISFGQPIQETGVDGYALKAGLTGEKLILAKKFLRFIMQKQVSADITGTKAISTMKDAQKLQPSIQGARKLGLDSAGTKGLSEGDAIIGDGKIPLTISVASTAGGINLNGHDDKAVYGAYNDFWMKGTAYNSVDYTKNTGASIDTFTNALDIYNKAYTDSLTV